MDNIVIATSEADASAAAAVKQHHTQLSGALGVQVESLLVAVSRLDATGAAQAKAQLVAWCEQDLLPHARAEETVMYPAGQVRAEGRLLVEGVLAEHGVITGLVQEIAGAGDPVRAVAAAKALQVVFDSHLNKENELQLR